MNLVNISNLNFTRQIKTNPLIILFHDGIICHELNSENKEYIDKK